MNNRVLTLVGKYRIVIAVSLLLFIAVAGAMVISRRPAVTPPRVVLADSAGFLTVGVGFSPDGKTFAGLSTYIDENGGGCWGGPVRLWDVPTGEERATLLDKHTQLPDIVHSPNSALLATVDAQGELTLWDVKTGKEWAQFQVSKVAGVSRWRPNFAFSPDGQTLAFENRSETAVTLWDVNERRERAVLPGASRPVLFSPDSQTLATAYNQTIRFWDVTAGKEKATTHGPPVQALAPAFAPAAFAPDGRTFATVSRKQKDDQRPLFQAVLWNVSNGAKIAAWDTEHEIWWLSFSPDGQLLTGRTPNLRPVCWHMSDLTPVHSIPMGELWFQPLIAPDNRTCAISGNWMSDIIFWDIARGEKSATFAIREDVIWDIGATFSPDSQILALSFSASQYDDWLGRATGGMFPGSQRVLAVPPSNGIKLLDVETGKVFATFEGSHWGEFSPDCKMWAMHGTDGNIAIWDVPARKSPWPIVLWSLSGILAVVIIGSWLRRARRAQDRAVSPSV